MSPPPMNDPNAAYGAPPSKGKGPLFWVLLGCGGIIVLGAALIGLSSWFVMHKAREAGLTPDQMQRNPALAAARLMVAANPDVEVVSVDEDSGKITIREKKTGKTVSMDFEDVKKGKLVFEGPEGQKVVVQGNGEQGSMKIDTPEGQVQVGGSAKAPSWVPLYPGAKTMGVMAATRSDKGDSGVLTMQTSDNPPKVVEYLSDQLKKDGFEVTRQEIGDALITITAKHADGRQVSGSITRAEQTTIGLTYQTKE
jgi:hypothetical protein